MFFSNVKYHFEVNIQYQAKLLLQNEKFYPVWKNPEKDGGREDKCRKGGSFFPKKDMWPPYIWQSWKVTEAVGSSNESHTIRRRLQLGEVSTRRRNNLTKANSAKDLLENLGKTKSRK